MSAAVVSTLATVLIPAATAQAAASVVIAAAGDIACAPGSTVTATTCQQAATARVIGTIRPSYVLPLGDLVYPAGTQPGFDNSYDPTWGKYKSITKPVPGHEYGTPGAAGYFGYFGARATPLQPSCRSDCKGYYSYSSGSWHFVALNTHCEETGGKCVDFSAQAAWLDQDLTAHPNRCTIAYMHNPLFSGGFGATSGVKPLWAVLQKHGVDLVITGKAHNYQRFKPQDENGRATASGITEMIIGTGGKSLQAGTTATNQAAHINHTFGVAKLTLQSGGWQSQFVSTTGQVLDPATGKCH